MKENFLMEKRLDTSHKSVKERNRTSPLGNDPGSVDRYIISSNWNVFEPGAAHTAWKEKNVNKKKILIVVVGLNGSKSSSAKNWWNVQTMYYKLLFIFILHN